MSHFNRTLSINFGENEDAMTINTEVPRAILIYIRKIFSTNQVYALMSIPFSFTLPEIFRSIFTGMVHRDLYVIIFVFLVCFLLFTFVFMADLITGLLASQKRSHNLGRQFVPKSKRLWSSFWKLAAFFVITFPLFGFIFVFYLLEMNFIYYLLLSISVIFMLLATFVEVYSVGENLKVRYGYKPKYFIYFDLMSQAFEKLFKNKLDGLNK